MGFIILVIMFLVACFTDASYGDFSMLGKLLEWILLVIMILGFMLLFNSCGL